MALNLNEFKQKEADLNNLGFEYGQDVGNGNQPDLHRYLGGHEAAYLKSPDGIWKVYWRIIPINNNNNKVRVTQNGGKKKYKSKSNKSYKKTKKNKFSRKNKRS